MMDRIKRGEESRDNTSSPIFQLQVIGKNIIYKFLDCYRKVGELLLV